MERRVKSMNTKVIKPPTTLPDIIHTGGFRPLSVFLAGSIEMGAAIDWQKTVTERIMARASYIFNPRRDDWNSTWHQDSPEFVKQVNWELDALTMSHFIFMYFDPKTKSPISLLELGLFASSGKLIVCCPNGFWRKGNVDIVCQRYGIILFNDINEAVYHLKERLIDNRNYYFDKELE
jgi:hypothetical protein